MNFAEGGFSSARMEMICPTSSRGRSKSEGILGREEQERGG